MKLGNFSIYDLCQDTDLDVFDLADTLGVDTHDLDETETADEIESVLTSSTFSKKDFFEILGELGPLSDEVMQVLDQTLEDGEDESLPAYKIDQDLIRKVLTKGGIDLPSLAEDMSIDTSDLSPDEVLEKILGNWRARTWEKDDILEVSETYGNNTDLVSEILSTGLRESTPYEGAFHKILSKLHEADGKEITQVPFYTVIGQYGHSTYCLSEAEAEETLKTTKENYFPNARIEVRNQSFTNGVFSCSWRTFNDPYSRWPDFDRACQKKGVPTDNGLIFVESVNTFNGRETSEELFFALGEEHVADAKDQAEALRNKDKKFGDIWSKSPHMWNT